MTAEARLYLDNAATSFPKPQEVHRAISRYASEIGASPGRGSYRESLEGAAIIRRCRERLRRLLNAASAEHVVFTLNTSDALNLALKGVVTGRRREIARRGGKGGVHVVTTAMDHNSVLRPLSALAADPLGPQVTWTCVDADPRTGLVDPGAIRAALRPETALVAVVHASNVSGTLQPVAEIGAVCRAAGVPLLLDAAQTVGRLPIDMERDGVDLLAFPGHKHLLGPLGTGGLVLRPGLEEHLEPLREGGTGTVSESDTHPVTMPDRYEPGSHNTLGLSGLEAALGWVEARGVASLWAAERELVGLACELLSDGGRFPGLRLLGPGGVDGRVGVFSCVHEAIAPGDLAGVLEAEFGVLGRAGLHCAPRAHRLFGTDATGGALRLSVGPFTTPGDLERAIGALEAVCADSVRVS